MTVTSYNDIAKPEVIQKTALVDLLMYLFTLYANKGPRSPFLNLTVALSKFKK